MSISAMQKVWDEADCTGGELLVLLCLADHVGNDQQMIAWPSMALIAKRARMSERGAQKALRRLEEKGLIEIERGGGRGGTNRYKLTINPEHQFTLFDRKKQENPEPGFRGEQSSGVNFDAENPEPGFTQNPKNPKDTRKAKNGVNGSSPPPDTKPAVLGILTEFIPKDQAESFLVHRRALRKPLATSRAANGVAKHLRAIRDGGGNPEQAIDLAMERGWLTCEAGWYFERVARGEVAAQPRASPAPDLTPEQREHYRELARQRQKEREH